MPITVFCTVSHINLFTFYRNWEFEDWISQVHQSIQSLISYYTCTLTGPLMISTLTTFAAILDCKGLVLVVTSKQLSLTAGFKNDFLKRSKDEKRP